MNKQFFGTMLDNPLVHGVPDPTTISRLMARLEPAILVNTYLKFLGSTGDETLSFDGKTMCAVPEKDHVRHILSFFSHDNHLLLGQVGVSEKGKEIPAFENLLKQSQDNGVVASKLVLGDALHTQKATVKAVLKAGADYLFVAKGNNRKLKQEITAEITKASKEQLDQYAPDGRQQPGRRRPEPRKYRPVDRANPAAVGNLGTVHRQPGEPVGAQVVWLKSSSGTGLMWKRRSESSAASFSGHGRRRTDRLALFPAHHE